jgi:hypothetical protein
LLVDPAGGTAWVELIADLVCGYTHLGNAGPRAFSAYYHFPLYIKSGSSLGVRARCAHSANITAGRLAISAAGEPSRPDAWWCGQKVETLGITAASSKGTDVTPGASGAFGSWTNVGGTISARYGSVQMGLNGENSAGSTAQTCHWQLGYSSTPLPGHPMIYGHTGTAEETGRIGGHLPSFCNIPAGTQMQIRGESSIAGPVAQNLAVYGVY